MKGVRGLAGVAIVMLAMGVVARAADDSMTGSGNDQTATPADNGMNTTPANPSDNSNSENTSATPAENPPPEGALMQGFDAIGIGKTMENWGLNVGGYIEGGYLYDFTQTNDSSAAKQAPGDDIYFAGTYKDSFMLNQAAVEIDRTIDFNPDKWDIGFRTDFGYGRDFYYTHSNGILDQDNKAGGGPGSFDQPDLLQAFVTLGVPVGNGIILKVGKFTDILGVEQIDPTQNLFYSHSYLFAFGEPYTETGILGSYKFIGDTTQNESSVFTFGATRGWNQTLYDDNGWPDFALKFTHTANALTWTIDALIGPEGNLPYGPADNKDWWLEPEINATYHISDDLTVSGNLMYGSAPNTAEWLSAAAYASYQLDKMIAINGRLEWYYDRNGVTTGVGGTDVDYTELTLGLGIKPFPDTNLLNTLTIRPEIRGDFSSQAVIDSGHRDQFTAAVDMYYKF